MVALSLAANQYSPRTLRNYMSDRGNRLVLGSLLGAFAYSLAALRMVRSAENAFVPSIAVLVDITLAVVSLAGFIYFVHHIAISLTATHIVSNVAKETVDALRVLVRRDENVLSEASQDIRGLEWHRVPACDTGYLQSIDVSSLVGYTTRRGWLIRAAREVGGFVWTSDLLFEVAGPALPDSDDIDALNEATMIVAYRSIGQDPAFGIREIIDVALKALSPGINDTTTAIVCIDYLGSILAYFVEQTDPGCCHAKDGYCGPSCGA